MLERLKGEEQSCLVGQFVSYEENEVLLIPTLIPNANIPWRHDTQHYDTQHNGTQFENKKIATLSIMAYSNIRLGCSKLD